jgi:carbamoyl-phosphate synthase small subunit
MKRYLVLEDGNAFAGHGFGDSIIATGELALTTGNYGYQEALTDPTNSGRILVFTTPMIGNTGINSIDYESIDPTVKGIISNDLAVNISANQDFQDLDTFLKEKNIPAIFNVDTRALARHLSNEGMLKASIMDTADEHAFDQIKALVLPKQRSQQISTQNAYAAPNVGKTIAVIDLGLKHSMLRSMSLKKANIIVLPATAKVADLTNLRPDAIILSNGPGKVDELLPTLQSILNHYYGQLPILGIGLGFLLIAKYLNFELIPLSHAFNGINYPVVEQNSNRIWQTAMNINYLVLPDSIKQNLNQEYFDLHSDLIAGFQINKDKVIAVAFNPEGAPGTADANSIFTDFMQLLEK